MLKQDLGFLGGDEIGMARQGLPAVAAELQQPLKNAVDVRHGVGQRGSRETFLKFR
jgi:hypothetical protein